MSCDKSCYDEADPNFGNGDCPTCPGRDDGARAEDAPTPEPSKSAVNSLVSLRLSREPPTVPGWYFVRTPWATAATGNIDVWHITKPEFHAGAVDVKILFAGPIPEPQDAN